MTRQGRAGGHRPDHPGAPQPPRHTHTDTHSLTHSLTRARAHTHTPTHAHTRTRRPSLSLSMLPPTPPPAAHHLPLHPLPPSPPYTHQFPFAGERLIAAGRVRACVLLWGRGWGGRVVGGGGGGGGVQDRVGGSGREVDPVTGFSWQVPSPTSPRVPPSYPRPTSHVPLVRRRASPPLGGPRARLRGPGIDRVASGPG